MPILVTTPAATPETSTGQVEAPTYSAPLWTWTTPAGRVRNLSSEHPYLRPGGIQGHMAAPVVILDSRPPTLPGGVYRGQRYEPRDVQLAVMAHTRESSQWRDTYRLLVADFDTEAGDGTLSVQHPNGETRSLSCRYVSGLQSPVEGEPGVVKIGTFVVELRAYDPWWYGPAVTRKFQVSTAAAWFPGPPFTLNPTELLGSGTTVANPGDVAAYPVWTVTGPCSSVTATAEDGSTWTVSLDLAAGETFTVDCDPRLPGNQKITDSTGGNLWGIATDDYPNLWSLPAGESVVTVSMDGASSASRVDLAFNPRYRTA